MPRTNDMERDMNQIEKKAREIYAAEYERDENPVVAQWLREGRGVNGYSGEVALRAIIAALSARQPVGVDPVAHVPIHPRNGPLWSDTYAAGDAADGRSPSYARIAAPPAPTAVPVGSWDALALRELIDEYWSLAYVEGKEGRTHDTEAGDAQRVSVEIDYAIRHLATHPQPAAANVELMAKAIYMQWAYMPGWTPWVVGGNSIRQDDARAVARLIIEKENEQ